jgi:hypothetical protein
MEIFERIGQQAPKDGQFAIAYAIHELACEVAQYRRDLLGGVDYPGTADAAVQAFRKIGENMDAIGSAIGAVATAIEEMPSPESPTPIC